MSGAAEVSSGSASVILSTGWNQGRGAACGVVLGQSRRTGLKKRPVNQNRAETPRFLGFRPFVVIGVACSWLPVAGL